jgi:hypothetical protein
MNSFFKSFFRIRAFILPSVLAALVLTLTFGQPAATTDVPDKMRAGFESINAGDSYSYLEFIAADELEGRDTPSKGLTIARRYIQSLYKTWGIKPAGDGPADSRSYEQRFPVMFKQVKDNTRMEFETNGKRQQFFQGKDFTCSDGADFSGVIQGPVVYAGYGLHAPDFKYDDFAEINVKDKVVMISAGRPGGDRPDSPFNQPENRARFAGRRTPAENCARLLVKKGAAALIIIDDSQGMRGSPHGYIHGDRISSSSNQVFFPDLAKADPMVPSFWASKKIADAVFSAAGESYDKTKSDIDETIRPDSKIFPGTRIRINLDIVTTNSLTANLLGLIEGSDPEMKDEYVVIGAHLDHVGMNEQGFVFNGADDNGSGSVGVLQAAKAFAMNPVKPKRSILFAHWTGEEKGLAGSRYYVNFPTLPMEKNVACVNMDMICKNTPLATIKQTAEEFDVSEETWEQYEDNPEKLLIAFTSSPSPEMAEQIVRLGQTCDLIPVPLSSFPMLGNSDHYLFCLKGKPSVFFNTGRHPDLHQPGDVVERINKEKMGQIVRLAYLLAFTIADMPGRMEWNEPGFHILPFLR